jgi:protein-S-isoprenylcysteine O-methyltransferase Ste14
MDAIPIFILLIRGRETLTQHQTPSTPFKLGRYGYLLNTVSVIFVFVTTVFFCFPAALPVGTNNMNYVSAVFGIMMLFLAAYWLFYGKRFEGPKFDVILNAAEEERGVVLEGEKDERRGRRNIEGGVKNEKPEESETERKEVVES